MENLNENLEKEQNVEEIVNLNDNSADQKEPENNKFNVSFNFDEQFQIFSAVLTKKIAKLNKRINRRLKKLNNITIKLNTLERDSEADNSSKKQKLVLKSQKITNKKKLLEEKLLELENANLLNKNKLEEQETFFQQNPYIKIHNLNKSFKNNKVLDNLDFEIKKGDWIAIVGENGAGKSTLSGIISGIYRGDSGKIDYNFVSSKENFGEQVAIQFQKLNYPEGYKVKEIVNFFYGMNPRQNSYTKPQFKHLIKDFGIDKFYHKSLVSLSGGQQQRVNLFLTFIKRPSFLILDELSAGLDIEIYQKIKDIFKEYIIKNNVTLLIISHNLSEIKFFADNLFLLKNGKLVNIGTTKNITNEKFFELIKRDQIFDRDFKFDFNVKKVYKSFFMIRWYGYIWNYFVYRFNTLEQIESKIEELHKKNHELIKKNAELQKLSSELDGKIDNKIHNREQKKIRKEFIKSIKKQVKVQRMIDDNSILNDKYLVLISDEYLLGKYKNYDRKLVKKSTKIVAHISRVQDILTEIEYDPKKLNEKAKLEKNLDWYNQGLEGFKKVISDNHQKILRLENDIQNKANLRTWNTDKKIEIINLKKYYDFKPALNGINLEIKQGERIAITGPNGSGKTTLAEILATTLDKTLGQINYWFGRGRNRVKHEIGMQFQESLFPYDLTVSEILTLFLKSSMWSISEDELHQLIQIFKIKHLLNKKGDVLSGGERQKLNVLIALLKRPSLLILDEISTGLDVESILDINTYITKYLDETQSTLILISHNPSEVKRLANKLVILKKGKIWDTVSLINKSEDEVVQIFNDIYVEKEQKPESREDWFSKIKWIKKGG